MVVIEDPSEYIMLRDVAQSTWNAIKEQPLTHFLAFAIFLLLSTLSLGILAGPLAVGYIRMCAAQHEEIEIHIEDIFSGFNCFATSFLTLLIWGVSTFVLSLFIVVPGLIVMILWLYAPFFIALQNTSTLESLKASWELVKYRPASTLLLVAIVIALNGVGLLTALGIFISGPITFIMLTHAFQNLHRALKEPTA
jgi:uncharacterized membrane protein